MATKTASSKTLADQLRDLVDACGLTNYQLGQLAGVPESSLWRFRKGERDLTLETASKVFAALRIPALVAPRKWPDPPERKR